MNNKLRQNGFSLTEVLLATGILAIGMVMIAMVFPVGVKLAGIATENTIKVVAANEAFAKMRLYGIKPFTDNTVWPPDPSVNPTADPNTTTTCTDYWKVCLTTMTLQQQNDQRCYPSLVPQPTERRYCWSALMRRADTNTNDVQTTVFVCRILSMGAKYYYTPTGAATGTTPVPVKVLVNCAAAGNVVKVLPNTTQFPRPLGDTVDPVYAFFTEGCMIVENSTGKIYKVLEMKDNDATAGRETLILQDIFPVVGDADVWVVPPAIGSSRNPCIDVAQTTLVFP